MLLHGIRSHRFLFVSGAGDLMPIRQVGLLAVVALIVVANAVVSLPSSTHADDGGASDRRAVKVVADHRLTVTSVIGSGSLALYSLPDWTQPLPDITRAFMGSFAMPMYTIARPCRRSR